MDAVSPAVRPDSAASFASYLTLVESDRRSLRSENKSPRTITASDEAHRLFRAFLAAQGMPQDGSHIRREHIETFLAGLHTRYMPATVANRYRALKVFFPWAVEEGEITQSPMRNVRAPHVPEHPPAVLAEAELHRLLRTCRGQRFTDRRDTAILRLLIDTGMRLGELAGLRVTDIDFEANLALVVGKGSRPRLCPFGRRTARALDRYVRARARRQAAGTPALWLGHAGPMTDSGVGDIVRRRATQAGVADVHPHRFSAHVRPPMARTGGQRNGPHAPRRLALPNDAGAVPVGVQHSIRRLKRTDPRAAAGSGAGRGGSAPMAHGHSGRLTPIAVRFWTKVWFTLTCWLWTASLEKGYGRFGITEDHVVPAHRWAYEFCVGPIPDGLHIDHLCRNRACVRPDHLEPITPAENNWHVPGAGTRTHCSKGHPRTAENTYSHPRGDRVCRTCRRERARRAEILRALVG